MRKNFSNLATQICHNEVFIYSPLSEKNTIAFCNIWDIFTRKQGGVTSQRVRIKIWQILFHPYDSWSTFCKVFDPNIFQFCWIDWNQFQISKMKNKKLVCPFLIVLFHFETYLIKYRFFLFSRPFWTVAKFLPSRSKAEKLAN